MTGFTQTATHQVKITWQCPAAYYKEWGGTVADLMSTELEVFDANLDLVSAAERFVKSAFRRFPVVEEGRLLGQVSRTDVLRALSLQWR